MTLTAPSRKAPLLRRSSWRGTSRRKTLHLKGQKGLASREARLAKQARSTSSHTLLLLLFGKLKEIRLMGEVLFCRSERQIGEAGRKAIELEFFEQGTQFTLPVDQIRHGPSWKELIGRSGKDRASAAQSEGYFLPQKG